MIIKKFKKEMEKKNMVKKLQILNFRNIDKAEYELTKNNIFTGVNNVGKTNTINALYWLLTGELLSDDLDKAKAVDTIIPDKNKEAVVEVTATLDTGVEIKRRYYQNWTRTRGTTEMVYQGNVTESFINNSKVKETEWLSKVLYAFGKDYECSVKKINKVAAVIEPTYLLMKTDYKDLRAFICEMVGGVTFEEILKKNPKYKDIESLVRVTAPEDLRTNYKTKINKFKEEITKKIGVIETLNSANPYDENEYQDTCQKLASKEKELTSLKAELPTDIKEKQMHQLKLMADKVELDKKKNELVNELNITLMEETQKAENPRVKELEKEISDIELKIAKIKNNGNIQLDRRKTADQLKNTANMMKNSAETEIAKLRKELNDVYRSEPEEKTCPNCGTLLNEEEITNFNTFKEARLEELKKQISLFEKDRDTATNREIEQATILNESTSEIIKLKKELEELQATKLTLQQELENARHDKLTVDTTKSAKIKADIKKVEEESEELEKAINMGNVEVKEQIETINTSRENELNKIQEELEQLRAEREEIAGRKMQDSMKKQAQEELDQLYKDQAEDELKLLLIDAFIKDKIKTLNDKASLFFGVDFILLEEQKNGGLKETCYPVVDGIPYIAVNTSKKQEIGIKLINKLRENLELLELPIIIDKLECLDDNNIKKIQADQLVTAKVTNDTFKLINY